MNHFIARTTTCIEFLVTPQKAMGSYIATQSSLVCSITETITYTNWFHFQAVRLCGWERKETTVRYKWSPPVTLHEIVELKKPSFNTSKASEYPVVAARRVHGKGCVFWCPHTSTLQGNINSDTIPGKKPPKKRRKVLFYLFSQPGHYAVTRQWQILLQSGNGHTPVGIWRSRWQLELPCLQRLTPCSWHPVTYQPEVSAVKQLLTLSLNGPIDHTVSQLQIEFIFNYRKLHIWPERRSVMGWLATAPPGFQIALCQRGKWR